MAVKPESSNPPIPSNPVQLAIRRLHAAISSIRNALNGPEAAGPQGRNVNSLLPQAIPIPAEYWLEKAKHFQDTVLEIGRAHV